MRYGLLRALRLKFRLEEIPTNAKRLVTGRSRIELARPGPPPRAVLVCPALSSLAADEQRDSAGDHQHSQNGDGQQGGRAVALP